MTIEERITELEHQIEALFSNQAEVERELLDNGSLATFANAFASAGANAAWNRLADRYWATREAIEACRQQQPS